MARKKRTDLDEVTAAYLLSKGSTQKEIATQLGLSTPVVSRLLKRARGTFFTTEVTFLRERVDDDQMRRIQARVSHSVITEALARFSQRVERPSPVLRVFPTPAGTEPEEELRLFAGRVAPYVRDLLARSQRCGVTWGGMLMHVVHALRSASGRPEGAPETTVIPLAGEPLGNEPTSSSSSTLANELGRLINGHHYHAKSLTMVPALMPKEFTSSEQAVVHKLMARLPDYVEIFGPPTSRRGSEHLAHRLDCVLTSVGREPLGFRFKSLLTATEQQLFIGDIGGVVLARPKLSKAELRRCAAIEDRWTGLRREHLERCAANARSSHAGGRPGVVVISAGLKRAPVIVEALRQGLINVLLIDSALEAGIAPLLSTSM